MALNFPDIDPVAVHLGLLHVRWYSLAYLAGIVGGWYYAVWLAKKIGSPFQKWLFDDYILWATFGIIIGGRLGYVAFYNADYFSRHLWQIFSVWQGGMAFHGGLLGMMVATFWFSRAHKIAFLHFADIICAAAPMGLFLGRLANFVNDELYGRVTTVPWAVKFPNGGYLPRHPSQIYEALLEGLLLFIVLFVVARLVRVTQRHGLLSGVFFMGYGMARAFVENFREADTQVGYYDLGLGHQMTQGQLLCLPMIALGVFLVLKSCKQPPQNYSVHG